MKSQALRIGAVFILAIIVFIGGWTLLYPSPDRRNIKYVLWKAGLYRMNLGQAEGIMILDPGRDDLVVGKTRAEIERRFGRLSPLSDASEYAKFCCAHGAACGNAMFIDDGPSPWMIVFHGDKASALFLIKGC